MNKSGQVIADLASAMLILQASTLAITSGDLAEGAMAPIKRVIATTESALEIVKALAGEELGR